jgi:hypothetical protein
MSNLYIMVTMALAGQQEILYKPTLVFKKKYFPGSFYINRITYTCILNYPP